MSLADLPSIEEVKYWKPEAQNKLLSMLQMGAVRRWRPFYCKNAYCNGQPHVWPLDERPCPWKYGHEWERDDDPNLDEIVLNKRGAATCIHCGVLGAALDEWRFPHARTDQRPPRWTAEWMTLFIRSGRGSGKTKTGAELTNKVAERVPRITLIGATGPDIRTTMVEGESGIQACANPNNKPQWEPSKKQLTWPNGAIALGYSAEEPDRLRGQNAGFVWADEPAHYPLVEDCWDNMLYGLRKGRHIKIVATSTPKATKWVKAQIADPLTIDRRVSSWANLTNLSPMFRRTLEAKASTRLGRQEIDGEILDDVEGALWKWEYIHYVEPNDVPELVTIVVAVDPAGTANKRSDETGIIVVGLGVDKKLYVLADETGKYSPEGWGRKVLDVAHRFSADRVVYEKNFGGEMVLRVLEAEVQSRGPHYLAPRFQEVTSRRGKQLRAEPIVALYEKQRVMHVGERAAALGKLDDELTSWVPGEGASPNRVDALVHGATKLFRGNGNWAVASPADL